MSTNTVWQTKSCVSKRGGSMNNLKLLGSTTMLGMLN